MTWNHRVMLVREAGKPGWYSVREVFYDTDGAILGWHQEPDSPGGETIEELSEDVMRYVRALAHPILIWDEDQKQLFQDGESVWSEEVDRLGLSDLSQAMSFDISN